MDDMHPQHHRQRIRPPTPLRPEIVGSDATFQPLPWNQRVFALQKLFPPGPAPLVLIVKIGEGRLLLHPHPCPLPYFPYQYPMLNHLFRVSLAQMGDGGWPVRPVVSDAGGDSGYTPAAPAPGCGLAAGVEAAAALLCRQPCRWPASNRVTSYSPHSWVKRIRRADCSNCGVPQRDT